MKRPSTLTKGAIMAGIMDAGGRSRGGIAVLSGF